MNGFKGIKEIIFAVLKGILFYAVGILIFSAVFNFFTVNESYIPAVRCGIMLLSAFLAGLWSVKGSLSKGYLRGIISGAVFAVIFYLFASFTGGDTGLKTLATYLLMIIMSALGGIIGINANN